MQKTTSNRNFAEIGTPEKDSDAKSELERKKPSRPSTSLPLPKAKPKPTAQKASVPIERLTRIFATTAPTFLPREKPTSSIANPACMRNTMQRGDDHPDRVDRELQVRVCHIHPPDSGNKKGRPNRAAS